MMRPDRVLGQARLNEHEAFRNFLEALKVAESSARQLALLRNQQAWLMVGLGLETMRAHATDLATNRTQPFEHKWVT
jgi:hypothetical protein